jgi:hypothetical protein
MNTVKASPKRSLARSKARAWCRCRLRDFAQPAECGADARGRGQKNYSILGPERDVLSVIELLSAASTAGAPAVELMAE